LSSTLGNSKSCLLAPTSFLGRKRGRKSGRREGTIPENRERGYPLRSRGEKKKGRRTIQTVGKR